MLLKHSSNGKSLRAIATDLFGGRVTHADIQRGLLGVFPKSPVKRAAMGLSSLIPAPACPHCGIVHVSKRCPERRRWKSLYDMPPDVLRWKMENREDI